MLVLELWMRLRSIKAYLLDDMYHASLLFQQVAPLYGSPVERLDHLREAFVALRRAVEEMEEHFGLPIAIDITQCVLGATCSAYELLVIFVKPQLADYLSYSKSWSTAMLWLAFHSLKLVAMALSCAAAENAARRTTVLLRRLPVLPSGHWAAADSLFFTAAGFVNIDRRLLVSVLGTVITYLVIIGQFTVNN
ncbi:uncharacterized protein LOC126335762 [Schistocerca gregaria]|uniref:uncharacterized protein LOC126335762 n=1 Tax=Schistocerca gregaria TaxID=7010 RepID=UPI00211DB1D3|nr:uncharacterized protein LOC126335762 [Schistocerca gregaria]